ncbi:MAG: hypothetical protein LC723_03685 [Actinobacteria bacterium]|nr:hypothetical protein [Actinomycetota bacterium]
MVSRVVAKAELLDHLISDLLDFGSLERGKLRIDVGPMLLKPLVLRVIGSEDGRVSAHEIHVNIDDDLVVNADPDAFGRVLSNLLTNAAKFSAAGSPITIDASRTGEDVVVSVTDTGIGIPVDERANIFERFYRVSRGERAAPGTGVGLAIAKDFVEAQGGQIWVAEPVHAKGTTISFTLPLVRDGADDESATSAPTKTSSLA